ncbi:MAG: NAD-dependent epimerase/dehydratase family protein [Chloroflexi bacterium]|nr:NAD-dependent epimerase/dehydratase family protein [Chloroflexota bacterium]
MARALVTGGTGFVGSWVARYLIKAGHEVVVMHRATSRQDLINDLAVEHAVATLDDIDALHMAVENIDWVFHVAAISAYWRNNRDHIYRVNVDGTRNLLLACESASVQRFIFTSSASAVGWREDRYPSDESTYFNVNPQLSPYAHSKFLAETEVHRAVQRGLDAVILNPAVVIGPGDMNQISGSLVIQVAQGKVPVMPLQGGVTYIDVRDVAASHVAAAEKGNTGEQYILGTVNMSHRAMLALIARIVGQPVPKIPIPAVAVDALATLADVGNRLNIPLPGDVEANQIRMSKRDIYFDCSKAWRELHEPEIDIYESLVDTYQWYAKNGYL